MNTITAENKIKPGYKKTSIGVIPEDWEVKEMGYLCGDICGEYGANKSAIPYSSDLPRYVRITDIDDEGNLHFDSKASADLSLKEIKQFKLEYNDLLFARTGATVGKSYLHRIENDKKFVYAGFLIRFRLCPNKVNPIFIKGYTDTSKYWHWVKTHSARSGQPGLNSNEYKSLKLPIPPLAEQTAIADCLSTWDSGIEKLSALIASKKEQKKGLMQGIFSGKKRLDGFTEEWKTKRLNVIGKVNYGTRIVKGNVEEGEYFVYGGGGKTFTNKEYNREDRMIIARFAMSKECARFVKGKFYLNDSGLTVDANEKTNQSFLDYLLFFNQHNIYKLRAGGAQQNLDVQAFRGISLSIPSIEEQAAIAEVLTAADKEIELLEQKLASFKMQKKGLMQVLLTGTKRLVES